MIITDAICLLSHRQLHQLSGKVETVQVPSGFHPLYGCESWTLTADLERRIQVFEHTCYRRLLRIPYTEHRTNEFVRQQVTNYTGRQEPLLAMVKRRKLAWYGHITRQDSLAKNILPSEADR